MQMCLYTVWGAKHTSWFYFFLSTHTELTHKDAHALFIICKSRRGSSWLWHGDTLLLNLFSCVWICVYVCARLPEYAIYSIWREAQKRHKCREQDSEWCISVFLKYLHRAGVSVSDFSWQCVCAFVGLVHLCAHVLKYDCHCKCGQKL